MSSPTPRPTVDVGAADDEERFLRSDLLTWFAEPPLEPTADVVSVVAPGDRWAAQLPDDPDADPTRYAGVYGTYPLRVTVPGPLDTLRQVPVNGLTWVGVHPDARRRGVLTAMVGHHLTLTREGGWSGLSALHASEPEIYGRYGYGVSSVELHAKLTRGATLTAPGLDEAAARVRTRMHDASDPAVLARLHRLMHELGAHRLGSVALPEHTLRRFLTDPPQYLRDREPHRVLLAVRDGLDVGYAVVRRTEKWQDDLPQGAVVVWVLDGEPAVRLHLLRRVLDLDLTTTVEVRTVGPDDLVFDWASPARNLGGATADSLWLRLADLPSALAARCYARACDVVMEVADAQVPANAGRWRLVVDDDGRGAVTSTEEPAGTRLNVADLGAAYLGGRRLARMLEAGRIEELVPGSVAALDAAFRSSHRVAAAVGF